MLLKSRSVYNGPIRNDKPRTDNERCACPPIPPTIMAVLKIPLKIGCVPITSKLEN